MTELQYTELYDLIVFATSALSGIGLAQILAMTWKR